MKLLCAAPLVQRYHPGEVGVFKVGGWIVERQMTVFADPDERNVGGALRQGPPDAIRDVSGRSLAIEEVRRGGRGTGRTRRRDPDRGRD